MANGGFFSVAPVDASMDGFIDAFIKKFT